MDVTLTGGYTAYGDSGCALHEFTLDAGDLKRLAAGLRAALEARQRLRARIGSETIDFEMREGARFEAARLANDHLSVSGSPSDLADLAMRIENVARWSPDGIYPDHTHVEPYLERLSGLSDIVFQLPAAADPSGQG